MDNGEALSICIQAVTRWYGTKLTEDKDMDMYKAEHLVKEWNELEVIIAKAFNIAYNRDDKIKENYKG